GAAKLISLYKKEGNDWQGNYYLTSKDDSNYKLIIKSKKITDFSLEVPGIVLQDLLPDSVKVFVSKIDVDNINVDIDNESNLDAYKQKAKTESQTKYQIEGDVLKVTANKIINENDANEVAKKVTLNPIKVPYVGPGKSDKIYFKAKYIFDGTGIFNGDVFGTKLRFRKAFKWDDTYKDAALKSNGLVSSIWYGTNYIPGSTKQIPDVPSRSYEAWWSSNWGSQYFWKADDNTQNLFENSIYGQENNKNGDGVLQLIENEDDVTGGQYDKKTKMNENIGTNYLIFPRITYKKEQNMYGYLWSDTVTILYFEAPNIQPTTQNN
ncbi:hypothetical protein LNO75_00990, partial [Mycoplasma sp. T363T]|uniref:hypothetical protein n=1 Tax=Mycoplasma bradburyae TaxID=2963128 RepID=UPI002340D1F3